MKQLTSPGARFRAALEAECPLQVVGAVNAFAALLAEIAGEETLYRVSERIEAVMGLLCGQAEVDVTTL